jgi:hypothetical protein
MDTDKPRLSSTPGVVQSADAFMSRLRPPAEEDVPLLTEVVAEIPQEAPAPAPQPSSILTAEAQAALRQELENWLDMHLTDAVLKVLDGLADQLVARVSQEAREDLLPRLEAVLEPYARPQEK